MPVEQVACTGGSHTVHGEALCLRDGGQDGVRVTTGLHVLLEQVPALRGGVCAKPEPWLSPQLLPGALQASPGSAAWITPGGITRGHGCHRVAAPWHGGRRAPEPARGLCLPGAPGWAGNGERRRRCPWGCRGEAAMCSLVPERGVV